MLFKDQHHNKLTRVGPEPTDDLGQPDDLGLKWKSSAPERKATTQSLPREKDRTNGIVPSKARSSIPTLNKRSDIELGYKDF